MGKLVVKLEVPDVGINKPLQVLAARELQIIHISFCLYREQTFLQRDIRIPGKEMRELQNLNQLNDLYDDWFCYHHDGERARDTAEDNTPLYDYAASRIRICVAIMLQIIRLSKLEFRYISLLHHRAE